MSVVKDGSHNKVRVVIRPLLLKIYVGSGTLSPNQIPEGLLFVCNIHWNPLACIYRPNY